MSKWALHICKKLKCGNIVMCVYNSDFSFLSLFSLKKLNSKNKSLFNLLCSFFFSYSANNT